MTPEEFAWIRANVWTDEMRGTWKEYPGFYTRCPCQWGPTWWCQNDRHDRCHRRDPQLSPGGYVCDQTGEHPVRFRQPYLNPSPSAGGSLRTSLAMWWYADRVCRWVCPCACHRGELPASASSRRRTAHRPAPLGQDGPGLFDPGAA
jgi:Family of unknown function (DUF6248)